MTAFFKKHWQSIIITSIALAILYWEYQAVSVWRRFTPSAIDNPFFVASGKWGIRFLLLSLLMSPLYKLSGWRLPLKLRKPLGLVAFMFVSVHAAIHIFAKYDVIQQYTLMNRLTQPWFVIFGVIAFVILLLMTITSIKPTMKMMGRFWKPLHRLVYVAGILIMLHSIIAATSGKRAFLGGEKSAIELKLYLVVLLVLLLLRVPIIMTSVQAVLPVKSRKRKEKVKRSWLPS